MAREGSPSDTGLYEVIEKHLKNAERPLTCVDLFDKQDVKHRAEDVNVVSNALGHLWRRDFIKRQAAPRSPHDQSKWAYYWPSDEHPGFAKTPRPRIIEAERPLAKTLPQTLLSKPNMTISDDGKNIRIDLPNFTIDIRAK